MDKMIAELYRQLQNIIATKTQDEMEWFMVEHFLEFPEEMRGMIISYFFQEGVKTASQNMEPRYQLQSSIMEDIDNLRRLEYRIKNYKEDSQPISESS